MNRLYSVLLSAIKNHSLRSRLIVWNLGIVLLLTVVLSAIYCWNERERTYETAERLLLQAMSMQLQSVQNWYRERAADVTVLSRLDSVRSHDKARILADFHSSLNSIPDFSSYAYANKDGITELDTLFPPGINVQDRDYFRASLEGKPFVSDILAGKMTGRNLLVFSNPVFDYNNQLNGSIFASVSVDTLSIIMQGFHPSESSKGYLLDDKGSIIAASRLDATDKDTIKNNQGFLRAKSKLSGIGVYQDHRGRQVIGSYQWIPEYNVIILCEIDEAEALAPYYQQIEHLLRGAVLVLFVTLLLTWLLALNLRQPIVHLSAAAQRVQNHDYSQPIPEYSYLTSPSELRRFCIAFNSMMGTIREHVALLHSSNQALSQAESKYRLLSTRDQLTGLYNRTYFETQWDYLTAAQQVPLSLVVCDVDGLKLINDTLGHQAGDELIRTFARLLADSFRLEDIIARVGGDEFIVLLPGATEITVRSCLDKLGTSLSMYNTLRPELPIAASSGSATATQASELNQLLNQADDMMYQNKEKSRKKTRQILLSTLIQTAELWDHHHTAHAKAIQQWSSLIGEKLQLTRRELQQLSLAAQYHDVGKVGIARDILVKPGPLTEREWLEIKRHPEIGSRIAKAIPELFNVSDFIASHHERWDGTGYPCGIEGPKIPLFSRIIAITDAYDAMQRTTPYRQAKTTEEAQTELRRCAGSQFDPELVQVFLETLQPTAS